jgi:hypothetical protein
MSRGAGTTAITFSIRWWSSRTWATGSTSVRRGTCPVRVGTAGRGRAHRPQQPRLARGGGLRHGSRRDDPPGQASAPCRRDRRRFRRRGAALRGLGRCGTSRCRIRTDASAIGADIPVCAGSAPARMRGIGEVLDPLPPIPPLWLVLANPGVEVPTGPVFRALAAPTTRRCRSLTGPMRTACCAGSPIRGTTWSPPPCALVPEVGNVLDALAATDGCRLARMSGSGGTCFGLFTEEAAAERAAERHAAGRRMVGRARACPARRALKIS